MYKWLVRSNESGLVYSVYAIPVIQVSLQNSYPFNNRPSYSTFISINYFNFISSLFPFLSIYDPLYLTFQFHFVLPLFDVHLTLFLGGSMSHLRILYHNCKGWSEYTQFLIMLNSVGGLTPTKTMHSSSNERTL